MEKPSILPDANDPVRALAMAVLWATLNIPVELLPDWVFIGEITLAQQRGHTVEKGEC